MTVRLLRTKTGAELSEGWWEEKGPTILFSPITGEY